MPASTDRGGTWREIQDEAGVQVSLLEESRVMFARSLLLWVAGCGQGSTSGCHGLGDVKEKSLEVEMVGLEHRVTWKKP